MLKGWTGSWNLVFVLVVLGLLVLKFWIGGAWITGLSNYLLTRLELLGLLSSFSSCGCVTLLYMLMSLIDGVRGDLPLALLCTLSPNSSNM